MHPQISSGETSAFIFVPSLSDRAVEAQTRALKSHELAQIWTSTRENLSRGFPTRPYPNYPAQLQRPARKVICIDIILSNKPITKALIRLRG